MRKILRRYLPGHEAIRDSRWLRPFSGSLLHPDLWHLTRRSAAGAVATGLACGLIPGPFQMLGAALVALLFRVNLPLALFAVLVWKNLEGQGEIRLLLATTLLPLATTVVCACSWLRMSLASDTTTPSHFRPLWEATVFTP